MGRRPRISRPLRRNRYTRPPFAIGLFLHPALAPEIFSMERADSRVGDSRSSHASLEFSRVGSGNLIRNALAALLEHRRTSVDVVDPVETGRPNFPDHSAALFV